MQLQICSRFERHSLAKDDFQLVYQPVPFNGKDYAFDSALESVVRDSEAVEVVSPYLTADVLKSLVHGRRFRLVTDQHACFEGGLDAELFEFLGKNSDCVRTIPGLHAKVVLGRDSGLFGSANLTKTGLTKRIEMASIVRGRVLDELREWFEALWTYGARLDLETIARHAPPVSASDSERRRAVAGLKSTGSFRWLARTTYASASLNAVDVANSEGEAGLVDTSDLEELACRLRELTEERGVALRALELLARALEYAGVPAEDERLHLNFGRKGRISITLGQRHVAWCRREGGNSEFALLLQSFDVSRRAVGTIQGAREEAFTKNKLDDAPVLYVPLEALETLDSLILADWEQAVRSLAQSSGKSSYLEKKMVSLYNILRNPQLRLETVRTAYPSAWWFGVNNGGRGHMYLQDIEPLFEGSPIRWPYGHSKTLPKGAYREMLPEDRVVLWTGRGVDERWGLIGTAVVDAVNKDHLVLRSGNRFSEALTPYPKKEVVETDVVRFLLETFGAEFGPLGDVYRAVYGADRKPPITVARISDEQVESVLAYERGLASA